MQSFRDYYRFWKWLKNCSIYERIWEIWELWNHVANSLNKIMKLERKSNFWPMFLLPFKVLLYYSELFFFNSNCLVMAEGTLVDHREDRIGTGYCNVNNVLIL